MALNKSQLPPPPVPRTLLTVDEFLSVTGIGRTQFYALRNRGLVRTVRIGTRGVRVPASETEALVQRLEHAASDVT